MDSLAYMLFFNPIISDLREGCFIKPQEPVIKETVHIFLGTLILCALMLIVFLPVGRFSWFAVLGALVGLIVAVGNFFLMAMDVQKVTTDLDPEDKDAMKQAKMKMKLSYYRRLVLMAVILVAAIKLLHADWIAAFLPLFFPRITIMVMGLIKKFSSKGSVY